MGSERFSVAQDNELDFSKRFNANEKNDYKTTLYERKTGLGIFDEQNLGYHYIKNNQLNEYGQPVLAEGNSEVFRGMRNTDGLNHSMQKNNIESVNVQSTRNQPRPSHNNSIFYDQPRNTCDADTNLVRMEKSHAEEVRTISDDRYKNFDN